MILPSADADAVKFDFSLPTGNFGDVLAGYYAYRMGLPTNKLLIATNENDILYRFFASQAYEKQTGADCGVKATLSPAMDILVSSNFERLLWYLVRETESDKGKTDNEELCDKAGQTVNGWMQELKGEGCLPCLR